MEFFVFAYIIRPNAAVFQQLKILADNTGNDPHSHAALLINAGNDKADVVLFPGTAAVVAGMSNGVDSVGKPDIHHALVDVGNVPGILALDPAQAEIVLPCAGYASDVRFDGNMLDILPLYAEDTRQYLSLIHI